MSKKHPDRKKETDILDDLIEGLTANPKRALTLGVVLLIAALFWQRKRLLAFIPEKAMAHWIDTAALYSLLAAGLIALLLVFRFVLILLRIQKTYRYIQMVPHSDDQVTKEHVTAMMRRFYGTRRKWFERLLYGREWYSFLIYHRLHANKGPQYCFYLGAEEGKLHALKTQLQTAYPRSIFNEDDDIDWPTKKAVGGRMKLKANSLKKSLPLSRYRSDQLPAICMNMKPGTWLQVGFSANDGWRLRKAIQSLEEDIKEDKTTRDRSVFEHEELAGLKHRYSGNEIAFDVTVSMASEVYPGVDIIKNVGNAINSILHDVNELKFRRWRQAVQWHPTTRPYRMTWTGSELANLVHLPHFGSGSLITKIRDQIPHQRRGAELLPDHILSDPEAFKLGYQDHDIIDDRDIRIRFESLMKHWFVSGNNGSGKSTVVMGILKSFIERSLTQETSYGFSFIDPHRQTALMVLNHILKMEGEGYEVNWDKIHWISFNHTDYPPAINLLHQYEDEDNAFVTDVVMEIIRNNFQMAQQAERLIRKCIETLLADPKETHTILGVKQLILDETWRMRIISRLKEKGDTYDLVQFWHQEAPELIKQSSTAVLNRMDIFSSNQFLRRLFGQRELGLPLREWMDNGHIVLFDFSGIDNRDISLIGGYLTYMYYRIAKSRDDAGESLFHQLVIDECQLVKAPILPDIISETRKQGLSLGLITQSITRLDKALSDALRNVQDNFFTCTQGMDDAKISASVYRKSSGDTDKPVYSEGFLRTLPTAVCAICVKEMIDGKEEKIFSVVRVPFTDWIKPNGEAADFKRSQDVSIAQHWTFKKIKELQAQAGLFVEDVDQMVQAYLEGKAPPAVTKRPHKHPAAPLQAKPVPVADFPHKEVATAKDTEKPKEEQQRQPSEQKDNETQPSSTEDDSLFDLFNR